MKCKRILPLNEKPSVITCIHHAYPCAIIESKELAYISVSKFKEFQWNEKTNDASIHIDNDIIKIIEDEDGKNTNIVLWRECAKKDEIIIHVDYVKPRDFARYIDIFLFKDDLEEEIGREDKTCGIRWNPYGFFIRKTMYSFDTKVFTYVKLHKDENVISAYASKNGTDWIFIDQKELPNIYREKALNIGIHMYLGKNYFDIWKNMNFIQLIYNEKNLYKGIYLDYYFFPRKNVDNSYSYFVNFIDTHYDSLYDAMDCFESIHEYIRWNINHSYYLNICLDEYYVIDRLSNNKTHYDHYNLFYGFDDEKRVYNIMGYGKNSTPIISEISYDVLNQEIITSVNIVRYKYSSNDVSTLKFNIKSVIINLYEFLHSLDSSEKVSNLLTEEELWYGISIINKLALTEIERVKNDKRITFCLAEHSKLMRERLKFLFENGYLENADFEWLSPKCDEIVNITSALLGLIIKNMFKSVDSEKINKMLLQLYDKQKEFCENLLKCLNRDNIVSLI